MIKFTYDTQRIEGSTLTLRETADVLEHGITPGNKSLDDVKEAEAHEKVFNEILEYKKDISLQIILKWHKQLLYETKPDIAGKVRKGQVEIGGSRFVPPTPVEMDLLLRDFFAWYGKHKKALHPIELAALVHLKFVTIHPFVDGNGRISRLMMNFILVKTGYPLFTVPYNNRSSYYTALERSQIKKEDYIFVRWFVKKYVKQTKGVP